jgi:Na+-transporting NADH:ubiquinone oxidoreductase subunit NqrD
VALLAGAVTAVCAVEALLPSVHEQVLRQVTLVAGAVIAVRTVDALLPSVHEQVLRQIALFAGAVIAVCAVEGLLPSVHKQVPRQVALVSGFEIAVRANVLHHHLAACATATGSVKQSRADRQHGCSHEETEPTGLTEPTERARCP